MEAARAEAQSLRSEYDRVLTSKRDKSMSSVVANGPPLRPLKTSSSGPLLKCRRVLKGHFGKVYSAFWSSDGKALLSASQDGTLLLWNPVTTAKQAVIALKSTWVMSCCMLDHGNATYVASGGLDNLCTIHMVSESGKAKVVTELASHDGFISACRFIRGQPAHILTGSGDATCNYWDVQRGSLINTFTGHTSDVMSMEVCPTNTNLFLSGSSDQTAKLYDVRAGSVAVQTYTGHDMDVRAVAFFPDGLAVATGGGEGKARIFDLRSTAQLHALGPAPAAPSSSSSNNNNPTSTANAAAGDNDHHNPMMDGEGGGPETPYITSMGFSVSGRLLFCAQSDGQLCAWDVLNNGGSGSGKSKPTFSVTAAHESHITACAVSPDGSAVCTASWDRALKIWA